MLSKGYIVCSALMYLSCNALFIQRPAVIDLSACSSFELLSTNHIKTIYDTSRKGLLSISHFSRRVNQQNGCYHDDPSSRTNIVGTHVSHDIHLAVLLCAGESLEPLSSFCSAKFNPSTSGRISHGSFFCSSFLLIRRKAHTADKKRCPYVQE